MTNTEIKAVTNQWLKSKGFIKGQGAYKAFGNCYVHSLPDFDVYIIFSKDRFSEMYYFEIGFQLRNNLSAWGHVRARIPQIIKGSYSTVDSNGIYGYYANEWTREDYLICLNKMYDLFVLPYLEQGTRILKLIAENPSFAGGQYGVTKSTPYILHRSAFEEISKL